jgi:hypothetical protein
MAQISFTADSTSGFAKIIAESQGLKPDTVDMELANRIWIDNFEGYESLSNLQYVWHPRAGTTADLSLAGSITADPGTSLRVGYTIGNGSAPYAGAYRYLSEDLSLSEHLEFWFKGDSSSRTLAILIYERGSRYWQYDYTISKNEPEFLSLPLYNFIASDTASSIKLDEIDEISFNILTGAGEPGEGIIFLDEINFVIPALETAIDQRNSGSVPDKFLVMQNYPNPFNTMTTIRYVLPLPGKVTIEIFDMTGRVVERLLSGSKQAGGEHRIRWQNTYLASGIYFYRIRSGVYEAVRKCILIK